MYLKINSMDTTTIAVTNALLGIDCIRNRSVLLADFETNTPNNFVEVKLAYNKGGMNYFTSRNEPRAYTIHVTPYERNPERGYRMYQAFSGFKQYIQETKRYSAKQLLELAQDINFDTCLQAVLDKNSLTIKS